MTEATRRAHGTGSIHPLKGGGYRVQIEAGWTRGGSRKRIRRNIRATGREGLKEAKAVLRELLAKQSAPSEGISTLTLKVWAERWLEIHVTTVRPATFATDRSSVRRWIIPTIGHRRLDRLTPADVRAVSRAILDAKLSQGTAQRTHLLLIKILRDAIVEGHEVASRLLEMDAPGRGEGGRDAIPLPEALAILGAASRSPIASRWVAALLQGLRPAECRGLRWSDVDLENDLMTIQWQLKALPYLIPRDRSSGFRVPDGYVAIRLVDAYHLVRPKTEKGKRTIPIVPWMHDALERWKLLSKRNDHDLVWPGRFGRPMNEVDDREAWVALCEAAKVGPFDLYSCRHTTVTLLTEARVDASVIRAIVGHASARSTEAYTHVQLASMAKALGDLSGTLKLDS